MNTVTNSRWSMVAFLSPVGALAVMFGVGRGIANEEAAMRMIGLGGICFLMLALASSICAFTRREKLRWLTPLPFLVILAMFTLGVSTEGVS